MKKKLFLQIRRKAISSKTTGNLTALSPCKSNFYAIYTLGNFQGSL